MKGITLFLPAALLVVAASCGEATTDEEMLNDLVEEVQEEMNSEENEAENEEESTASFEVPEGSQAWDKFVATYDKDYDMIDGNPSFDGKELTLTGVVEKVVSYQDSEGNDFAEACFGVTDDMMGKCKVSALFNTDQKEALETAKKEGTAITFKGMVKKKKFDQITIESSEMIAE